MEGVKNIKSWTVALSFLVGLCLVISSSLAASTQPFALSDHPATYSHISGKSFGWGLRLDNLFDQKPNGVKDASFQAKGGTTKFSFQHPGAQMNLVVEDVDSDPKIHIFGKAYGGEIYGETFGFGEGYYEINFWYNVGVSGNEKEGWTVEKFSSLNSGTITKIGDSSDVKDGTAWTFFMAQDLSVPDWGSDLFKYAPDGFIPDALPDVHIDPMRWVGRGALTYNSDGSASDGMQGLLFAPLPTSTWMGLSLLIGLGIIHIIRNRRHGT